MKIYKEISQSKNGKKKEIIAEDKGNYFTRHLVKHKGAWYYCSDSYRVQEGNNYVWKYKYSPW
jgi:hypothetical protein